MRRLACTALLSAMLPFATVSAQSPFAAGQWAFGASGFAALQVGTEGPTVWGLDVAPQLSYFVRRGLALDATVRAGFYGWGSGSKLLMAAGPGVTWYPFSHYLKDSPFLSTRIQFARYREAQKNTADRFASGLDWRATGGVLFPMGRFAGVQIGAWYEVSRFRFDQSSQTNRAPAGQTGIMIGIQRFLQKAD